MWWKYKKSKEKHRILDYGYERLLLSCERCQDSWPLEEQKFLFPVLDCAHSIGLTLTESCMMAPIKSVTAVIAVEDVSKNNHSKKVEENEKTFLKNFNCNQNEKSFSNLNNKCLRCNKIDCEFRKK